MEDDIRTLNTRFIGQSDLKLPDNFKETWYACPMNKEGNSVTATEFHEHLKQTHPDTNSGNILLDT